MIFLRRLAHPNRWCDLVDIFGRAEPELSTIFNIVISSLLYLLLNDEYNIYGTPLICFFSIRSLSV